DASGNVVIVGGAQGTSGYAEGSPVAVARFRNPSGLVADSNGDLYVSDTLNNRIRKLVLGSTTSLVGGTGTAGFSHNADATLALFRSPRALAVSGTTLYVSDSGNHCVRSLSTSGTNAVTIAGNCGTLGTADGTSAGFNSPNGLALVSGKLYVA